MISLEQVQLLETRVARAIEYAQKIAGENAALVSERVGLQAKLDANQRRIDELEVLVMRFKEDQGRIEDGIIAALDRLSQFEEAFEKSLKDTPQKKTAAKTREKSPETSLEPPVSKEIFFEIPEKETVKTTDPLNGELPSETQPEKKSEDTPVELDIF
ncbi:MAG: cell division protein ZapB [Treponema sp.]|jgi:predicted nuclease with TOPRIM domain|nr:cell division protein ZapB [Treponema sp.]